VHLNKIGIFVNLKVFHFWSNSYLKIPELSINHSENKMKPYHLLPRTIHVLPFGLSISSSLLKCRKESPEKGQGQNPDFL